MYSDISTSAVLTAAHLQRATGLEINGVSKSFGAYTAIEHVNLEIHAGEFVSLIGHSGCGKSTLLSLIAGLELPSTGSIRLDGLEILKPSPDRAVVFQNYSLLPWLNVYQNVSTFTLFPFFANATKRHTEKSKYKQFNANPSHNEKPNGVPIVFHCRNSAHKNGVGRNSTISVLGNKILQRRCIE